VLFVGDSFTGVQGGIDSHFQAIAASMVNPHVVAVDRVWQGGATLQVLRTLPDVLTAIRTGGFEVVVLQDDIPEYVTHTVDTFKEQVRWFDPEIRAHGGRPALFMAWAYERLNWVTLDAIAQAHREIGAELGIPVAPVGLAFQASTTQRPALAMLDTDREHESLAGMYLAACVMCATLFHESPEGARYVPTGLTAGQAAFLQTVAWTTVNG
jgi:hypothetical protein